MILLYRSPNVRIDDADWHVTVSQSHPSNRPVTRFLFRLGASGHWHPITNWPSERLPKGLRRRFATYRKSINTAIASARVTSRISVYQEAA